MFFKKNPIDIHLAKRLRAIRNECGVTQDALGALIGTTHQQIQKYETGLNRISASRLYEICRVLNKPLNSFFEKISIEEGYYNFEFTPEEIVEEKDKVRSYQTRNLLKFFSTISDEQMRIKIVNLVESIAEKRVTRPIGH